MAHRFGLGTPCALTLLMCEMQLCALLRSTTYMHDAATIGAIEQAIARPALQLCERRLFRNGRTPIRAIGNQHSTILPGERNIRTSESITYSSLWRNYS